MAKKEKIEKETSKNEDVLGEILGLMDKEFGKGTVSLMNNNRGTDIERWKLRSLNQMDLTGGGIPKGRIVELYGPESNGKTTLATIWAGEVQSQDGIVAYIDVEHAFDPAYAKTLGLDITKCIFTQPSSGEEAINIAIALAKSGKVSLIVVDSVAALVPLAELEGEMANQQMGAQARLMGKACRKLTPIMGTTKTSIVFINQLRMKIGVLYGSPETTAAGMALKFYSSIRIDVRKSEYITEGTGDDKKTIGMIINLKTVKNKVGMPFKKKEMTILYGKGLQFEAELADFSVVTQVIKKVGNTFYYNDNKLAVGRDSFIEVLKTTPSFYAQIEYEVLERMNRIVPADVIEESEEIEDNQSDIEKRNYEEAIKLIEEDEEIPEEINLLANSLITETEEIIEEEKTVEPKLRKKREKKIRELSNAEGLTDLSDLKPLDK